MANGIWSPPKGRRGWTLIVLLISQYLILLQSIAECVLVILLYAMKRVDSTMAPSLVLSLIASFFSIPFVFLHTLLAWQFKKSPAFNVPRTRIHMACSYLPRFMIMLWLAATAAGLIVVSKQPACIAGHSRIFWKAGVGCALHRASVIVAVFSFATVSALFCAVELCHRPYDASLMGLYTPQRPPRERSTFSSSSWESETLKNEIFYLCRHPNAGPGNGELYWSPNVSSIFEQPVRPPSIRCPAPARTRPQLRISTHTASIKPEIHQSSTAPTPIDNAPKSVTGSVVSDASPISRNPTPWASQNPSKPDVTIPAIPELPGVPSPPAKSKHTRQKSSVSSRRRFLPKAWLKSDPLSADPQIRALSSPDLGAEMQPQTEEGSNANNNITDTSSSIMSTPPELVRQTSCPSPMQAATVPPKPESNPPTTPTPRAMSTAPGSPPAVLPPEPLTVRKSRSSYIAPPPRSIHHPHNPNYVPPPPNHPSHGPPPHGRGHGHGRPLPSSETDGIRRHNTRRHSSTPYRQFDRSQILRHTQSHRYHRHQDPRRFHGQRNRFDPSRALPPIPHSDDVEIVYPSTRRSRSSTYGGFGVTTDGLGMMRAGTRSSVNLSSGVVFTGKENQIDPNTYRGAQRTSIHGLLA
ncbi:hypothetical protein VTN00DRAFT_6317 [Thermoascus crustaceus]|uniref:uncharacterized protein n=1 Tax=Thermoascus crustaceus TaxID=5088 RepID=UPI003744817E